MAINEHMKWPGNKLLYDQNYLRLYGKRCEACKGLGYFEDKPPMMKKKVQTKCIFCKGIGFVEKTIANIKP